ncbi:MAG TPA: histidine kinase N-terminal 7TM domain-containing protein [Aggregatilinea sp.]|uniref:histidine kinase N-terminal 7TM domain-containing protein n=1 Tax=Aggregatilinea sp. TaxID=2806333 RepID=UPI002B50FFB3|nr:histidine kinase N-terminal 7TM domain-containing protein [Aggregatilinea sp.]HML22846.1 histidine kinase N-terminal 7TM domain-containing protein [Aggregatilinea sp.]
MGGSEVAWQSNPYVLPLIIGALPLFGLAFVAWQRGHSLDTRLFVLSSLSSAGMILSYAMELLAANESAIHFWLKIEYFFIYVPGLWLLFVLAYTGYEKWITPRNMILIFTPSTIQTLAAWTNSYHHLNWATVGVVKVNGLVFFDCTYGPIYILGGVYYVILALLIIGITAYSLIHAPRIYRAQLGLLLLAVMGPLATYLITSVDNSITAYYDITPFGFIFACFAIGWSLLRYRLLDLIPPAHAIVMNSITDTIFVLDTQNRIVDVNSAGEAMLETRTAAVIGQPASVALAKLPGLLERYQELRTGHTEIELQCRGRLHIFDMRISPIYAGSRLRGRVVVLRDITDRKDSEETIRRYARELETRNNELDAFTHTVAHDLKTPLQIIVGYTELLDDSDGDVLSEEGREYLSYLQESATQMRDMIGELLLLAQLRNPDMALTNVSAELAVRGAIARLRDVIVQRDIELQVRLPLPPTHAHPVWLEEILANLIGNAIKYIGRDNPAPRIEIRGSAEGENVCYDIIDNGLGIAPENLERLFEMFTRFHQGEASGSGIGLSIVQRIVTRLHGEIRVESAPGKGSTFSVILPAATTADITPADVRETADRSLALLA